MVIQYKIAIYIEQYNNILNFAFKIDKLNMSFLYAGLTIINKRHIIFSKGII